MSVITIRPASTLAADGAAITGDASIWQAWDDEDEASYVTCQSGEEPQVTLTNPTIPAGAVIKQYMVLVKVAKSGGGASTMRVLVGDDLAGFTSSGSPGVNWSTPTTIAVVTVDFDPRSYWDLDDLDVQCGNFTGSDLLIYAVYVDFTYVAEPSTNITTPTGTLTEDNTPEVDWANTLDSDGGVQAYYEVEIGASGFTPGTDAELDGSGITAGSDTTWEGDVALTDANYSAAVRVGQLVNGAIHWSPWDTQAFTVNVLLPGVPALVATADNATARIALALDDSAGESGTTTEYFQVQYLDGATYLNVRTSLGSGLVVPSAGVATIYDYESANGVARTYRARSLHQYTDTLAASAWSTTDSDTWTSTSTWLKHSDQPSLNAALTLVTPAESGVSATARQGVFTGAGSGTSIVISDKREGSRGTLRFVALADADKDSLDGLIDTLDPLLLQFPAGSHESDRWLVFGDHTRTRVVDKSWAEPTYEDLPWTEVDAP